jgi:hypothetical protein
MASDVPATISLEFDGYWLEPKIGSIPKHAGIYCVYACTYNADDKPKPTVSIKKLLYIGEAGDVNGRISGHELWPEWKEQLMSGQVICASTAPASPVATRQRAEAALIFQHKPPVNVEYKHSFPFDTTTVTVSGKAALLTASFKVAKDAKD